VRPNGTLVQVGIVEGEVTVRPRSHQAKCLTWVHPRARVGTVQLSPRLHTGELAPELVVDGTVTIEEFVTHELTGLGSVGEAVELTLDGGTFGPAQIVVP
jgi:threonine dehydrogenase-like Zn-dependent dehydrogenase